MYVRKLTHVQAYRRRCAHIDNILRLFAPDVAEQMQNLSDRSIDNLSQMGHARLEARQQGTNELTAYATGLRRRQTRCLSRSSSSASTSPRTSRPIGRSSHRAFASRSPVRDW